MIKIEKMEYYEEKGETPTGRKKRTICAGCDNLHEKTTLCILKNPETNKRVGADLCDECKEKYGFCEECNELGVLENTPVLVEGKAGYTFKFCYACAHEAEEEGFDIYSRAVCGEDHPGTLIDERPLTG